MELCMRINAVFFLPVNILWFSWPHHTLYQVYFTSQSFSYIFSKICPLTCRTCWVFTGANHCIHKIYKINQNVLNNGTVRDL